MESCHQCSAVCKGEGVCQLLLCLGKLGEINRCIQQHFWLHPATAITVHGDTNAPWGDSYWHHMGRLEEGDTNSTAWQAKFSWAIAAKVTVIFSLKAKYYHSKLSCLPLNVHSQKIIWKKLSNPRTLWFLILPCLPSPKGPLALQDNDITQILISVMPWRNHEGWENM